METAHTKVYAAAGQVSSDQYTTCENSGWMALLVWTLEIRFLPSGKCKVSRKTTSFSHIRQAECTTRKNPFLLCLCEQVPCQNRKYSLKSIKERSGKNSILKHPLKRSVPKMLTYTEVRIGIHSHRLQRFRDENGCKTDGELLRLCLSSMRRGQW